MKRLTLVLFAITLTSTAITATSLFQAADNRIANPQRERDKLKKLTDPVSRARAQIKISDILLSLTGDSVRNGDLGMMGKHLDDYLSTIQDAHQTMVKTGRDAHKKPGGFKDL